MLACNARYDGKVLVPETPLALPANQRVRISVEPIESTDTSAPPAPNRHSEFHELIGLGLPLPPGHTPRFADDDALWEGSIGDTLVNDPRKQPHLRPSHDPLRASHG